MNGVVVVVIALVFVGLAGYAIATGETNVGRRGSIRFRVRRADSPVAFWLMIGVYIAIAVITVVTGWPRS